MTAYTLPAGNVQIAFSGGRTSAYMLHQILETNGPLPDRVVVSFQNTGREMPETLDFVQECSDRWRALPGGWRGVLRMTININDLWPGVGGALFIVIVFAAGFVTGAVVW